MLILAVNVLAVNVSRPPQSLFFVVGATQKAAGVRTVAVRRREMLAFRERRT